MLDPFSLPYVQRALLEIVLLSFAAGVLGTWIVLRGLSFYAHAVGTAAFPGLVLAGGLGFAAALGAFGTAAIFAVSVGALAARRRTGHDALTALVLVGCLAAGIILASDVFHSGAGVENLLFGSLLTIGHGDVVLAGAVSAVAVLAALLLGERWMVSGFDPGSARTLGVRSGAPDAALLALVALAATAALSAVGALLVSALLVVPAATTRLFFDRMRGWQSATVALVLVEGVAGLWLSVQTNAPPGATIATLAAGAFAVAALVRLVPRRRLAAGAAALLALAAAGCASTSPGSGGRLLVVATTTQLADFARTVGGPSVDVHQILQPNTDPHEYEPRPQDVSATADAKVVFENGDGLDAWMGKVVSSAGGHPRVVDVGAAVPVKRPGEASGSEAARYDPHWWHDPVNAQSAAATIATALGDADPAHRAAYRQRMEAYSQRLGALTAALARCFSTVPPAQRRLVTDHDAFGYFAQRFGITVVGAVIPSQTTQGQPSAGDVARLAQLIRRERVTAVFPESSMNARLAHAIARETGARSDFTLYGDTLGPEGSAGATYLTMEAANADAMVRGFTSGAHGCALPGAAR